MIHSYGSLFLPQDYTKKIEYYTKNIETLFHNSRFAFVSYFIENDENCKTNNSEKNESQEKEADFCIYISQILFCFFLEPYFYFLQL